MPLTERPFERHPLGKNHGIIVRICVALHPRATFHPYSKVIYFPVSEFWAPASFPWEFTAFEVGAPVGLVWVHFGFRLRFPEILQHLSWAPVYGLLLGSCGFRRCFYENLQHLRWAPVWALVGSSDVSKTSWTRSNRQLHLKAQGTREPKRRTLNVSKVSTAMYAERDWTSLQSADIPLKA